MPRGRRIVRTWVQSLENGVHAVWAGVAMCAEVDGREGTAAAKKKTGSEQERSALPTPTRATTPACHNRKLARLFSPARLSSPTTMASALTTSSFVVPSTRAGPNVR